MEGGIHRMLCGLLQSIVAPADLQKGQRSQLGDTQRNVQIPKAGIAVNAKHLLSRQSQSGTRSDRYTTGNIRSQDMPKVCDHFHLSLQSGCDKTLKEMNRKYDTEKYRQAAATLRKYLPEVALTTDIIAGFPGETEEDFQARKVMILPRKSVLQKSMHSLIPLRKAHLRQQEKTSC